MKNKILFLLSFFLLLPLHLQCMKRCREEITESSSSSLATSKPLTIQELEEKHQEQYACIERNQIGSVYLGYPHNQTLWSLILKSDTYNLRTEKFAITCNGYSLLGIAALLSQKKIDSDDIINYHQVIKKLIQHRFEPTENDQELAFLLKYKKCAPSISHIRLLIQHSLTFTLPQEIINYIALLIFKTEKSLF